MVPTLEISPVNEVIKYYFHEVVADFAFDLQSSAVPLWCMVLAPKVVNSLVVPTLSHHL